MNPHEQFCPNSDCPARGKVGAGNIVSHSQKEQRCKCTSCGRTFSIRKGTALYGIKHSVDLFVVVVTLLAHGCPLQAIVAAFGLDERTVRSWYLKAGAHCQQVHEQIVGHSQLDLGQVQADEIKVKTQQGTVWMALALMVSTRLWLGGVVSSQRDKRLIGTLVAPIRAVALCRVLLLAVDGLVSYVAALQKAFCSPLPTGKRRRRRLMPWQGINIVQVVKRRTASGLSLERRIMHGDAQAVATCLKTSQGGGQLNTAFIERLNATFCQCLACLGRRSRSLARQARTLQAGMCLVGCVYNFCNHHTSLRLPLWISQRRCYWVSAHRPWLLASPTIVGLCWNCSPSKPHRRPLCLPNDAADLQNGFFRRLLHDHAVLWSYRRGIGADRGGHGTAVGAAGVVAGSGV